jgi:hypothetical protein
MSRLLWSLSPRRIALSVLTLLVVATSVVVFQANPAGADGPRQRLKAATARYHSVKRAVADGFVPTEECAELPGVGGMGYHYVNPERLQDGVLDPARPEILLYVKEGRRLRLAGAEFFAVDPDQDLATDAGRPELFGQPFDGPMPGHGPGMPIHFDLHAWVWKHNPAGTFAAWNPRVTCD